MSKFNKKTYNTFNTYNNFTTGNGSVNNTVSNSLYNNLSTNRPLSRESALSGNNNNTAAVISQASTIRQDLKKHRLNSQQSQFSNQQNLMSENETISTAANFRSKNFSRSHTAIDSGKSRSKVPNLGNLTLNLKKEMFDEIGQATFSPKNIKGQEVKDINKGIRDIKGQNAIGKNLLKGNSDNNVIFSANRKLLPNVNLTNPEINEKYQYVGNTGSSMSITMIPKRLTEKKIEEEQKYLKEFMKSTMMNLDENTINKNLKLPKSNKNINQMWDFINGRKKQQTLKKQLIESLHSDNKHSKQIENLKKNPSLGPEYIRKNYSYYLPKDEPFNYDNRFKNNYTKKYFGSVLFAKRVKKEEDSNKYDNVKNNKFTQVSKLKMKWKTIKWILENKKDVLDRLMGLHESILKMTNKKSGEEFDKGMTKQEFLHVMRSNGITNDVGLINKIFWMFDEDGDNHLKYKEIAFGIEMFRESSMEQKLKAFFDLCDVDNSGAISKQEFLDLMKKNIINSDEKLSIKHVVDKIFNSVKLDKNGEITFEKLKEGCEKNKEIQDIIDKNLLALKSIDHVIDKDIRNDILRFNPELNDQLRMKLLCTKISFTPLREEKFARLLNNYISNREDVIEMNKIREVNEDDSIDLQEDDKFLFEEEKNLVTHLTNKWHREAEKLI